MAQFLKDNFNLVILAVSMLGVLIACISLVYEVKKKKSKNQKK